MPHVFHSSEANDNLKVWDGCHRNQCLVLYEPIFSHKINKRTFRNPHTFVSLHSFENVLSFAKMHLEYYCWFDRVSLLITSGGGAHSFLGTGGGSIWQFYDK